jgi:hypothetical protein
MLRSPDSLIALACAALVALAPPARAQVTITLDQFGAGGCFRGGDVVPILLSLQTATQDPVSVEVAWELPNNNGDVAQHSRVVVCDPGQPRRVWLYGRAPNSSDELAAMGSISSVRAWEHKDGQRGAELGSARIAPNAASKPTRYVSRQSGLIGIVGNGRMGLDALGTPPPGMTEMPTRNETTQIARGIMPQEIPDRWEGLSSFAAIIWSEGSPQSLSPDAARALRDWISLGGVFVIVLPERSDPWGVAAQAATHAFSDLMPDWKVDRTEETRIADLLPAISKVARISNQKAGMPVAFFEAPSTASAWDPIVVLPAPKVSSTGFAAPRKGSIDGKVIGITRPFGAGRITVLGLDVNALHRRALSSGGLPEADVFWNPILGVRGDSLTAETLRQLEEQKLLVEKQPTVVEFGRGNLVSSAISMSGEVTVTLLAAFLLFASYWVVAGPGGFYALRLFHRERYAWLLFVLAAMAFGGGTLAWGTLQESRRSSTQHVTVLTAIRLPADRQRPNDLPLVRATAWVSALITGYGRTTVEIDRDVTRTARIEGWESPSETPSAFPNPSRIPQPIDTPMQIAVAARGTSASFEVQWLGSIAKEWGELPRASDPARPLVQTVVAGPSPKVSLSGLISHSLPFPLTQVGLLHITPIRQSLPNVSQANALMIEPSGELPYFGRYVMLPSWNPNSPIEIAQHLYPGGSIAVDERDGDLARALRVRYQQPWASDRGFRLEQQGLLLSPEQRRTFFEMLGIFSALPAPGYIAASTTNPVRFERMLARDIDLSHWLSTPCLIVTGFLDPSDPASGGAECPVPLRFDGRTLPSSGLTFVRVVFPLPVDARFAIPPSR